MNTKNTATKKPATACKTTRTKTSQAKVRTKTTVREKKVRGSFVALLAMRLASSLEGSLR